MKLPTAEDYQRLYQQYSTPSHIQDHMRTVARLAVKLAEQRALQGDVVSISLVETAALLHDLVRIPEQWSTLPSNITTPESHAEINYLILRDDYPELAEVVRDHSLMTIFEEGKLTTLEQQIVYYADKRVNHDQVVSIIQRLELSKERWGVTPENDRTPEVLTALQTLESNLFTNLSITPKELN